MYEVRLQTAQCTFSILMFPVRVVHDWRVSPILLLHRYCRSLILSIIYGLLTGGRLPTTGNCWIAKIGISVLLFAKCEYSVLTYWVITFSSSQLTVVLLAVVTGLRYLLDSWLDDFFVDVLKLWWYSVFSYSLLL